MEPSYSPFPGMSQDEAFMDLEAGTAPSHRVKLSRISAEEWEEKRVIITEYYWKPGWTLPRVMEYMEQEQGFRATEPMYKKQIKKWGLDKNLKETEVMAIVRKKKTRDALGKDSAFRIRGSEVDMKRVEKYLNRKGLKIDEVMEQDFSDVSTPSDISSFTPTRSTTPTPPAATPNLSCSQPSPQPSTPSTSIAAHDSLQSISEPQELLYERATSGLYRSPATLPHLRIIEEIFKNTEDYLQSFQVGTTQSPSSSVCFDPSLENHNMLMDMCDSACWLMSRGEVGVGDGFVAQFKDAIEKVEEPYPALITLPYQIFDEFSSIPDFRLPTDLLRHTSTKFASRFGETHPISVNCRHLLNFPNRHELLLPAMKQICDILPKTFGRTNPHTLDAQSVYNSMLISLEHYADAENRARYLLADCETSLGMKHDMVLEFRNQFAFILLKQGNYLAAEKMARLNLQTAGFSCRQSQPRQLKDAFLFNLRTLYLTLSHQGKVKLAETLLRGALRLSIHFHRELHYSRAIVLADLKKVLENQGKIKEAERVSKMNTKSLCTCTSYLAENDWDPHPHTVYCSCVSGQGGFDVQKSIP